MVVFIMSQIKKKAELKSFKNLQLDKDSNNYQKIGICYLLSNLNSNNDCFKILIS